MLRRWCRQGWWSIVLFGLLGLLGPAQAMPHYGQVKQAYRSSDWVLLDRHGEQLQVLRQDFSRRAGAWVPLEQISPALLQAVLASEDKRYYDHGGVDWLALAGAGWDSAVGSQLRGASTISMQLAGMLQEGLQRAAGGRTVMQKWQQIQAARQLEGSWSKQQILEAYLNLVSFRGEIQGVDALSRVLFQKQAVALTVRESALAAALLRGPNAPQAVLRRRTCALLLEVARGEQCQGLADFLSVTLARHAQPAYGHAQLAPHFARLVQQQLPASVRTEDTEQVSSLDAALQNHVKQSIRQQLLALNQAYVQDAAAVVLAVETGEILAYVGSSSDLSQASQVDHAVALRQAGSTLKPFLYAQALDQRRISAASLLHDAPLNLPTGNGLYVPQNYDKSFTGWVSARTALASSLNIPAVRVLTLLGAQSMVDNLLALGLPLKQSGQFYGYSLALGSADVDLLSLTNAYRALAQGGQASDWHWQRGGVTLSPSTSRSVYSPQAAWLIGDILSDRQARVHTFGLDSVLSTPFWSAVKTGTSKDMRDNWAIGWSEHYVVGVWVGNSSGASMQDVSGVSGAAPIWHDIMRYLHAQLPSRATAPPEGLHSVDIHYQPALEAARTEYFLTGTEQAEFVLPDSATDAGARPSITRPVAGTILALDPDIPPANQRLLLQAKGDPQQLQGLRWVINGQLWASGAQAWWPPQPGRQTIEIYSAQQQRLDTLTIEVRGAQRKEVRKH